MIRSLLQFERDGRRGVAALDQSGAAYIVTAGDRTLDLAEQAVAGGIDLDALVATALGAKVDLSSCQLLSPIDHADPAHLLVSGTGLTHMGSAEGRDKMHKAAAGGHATDSMKMFLMGLKGGRPAPGAIGAQPEWFYKGDGSSLVPPGAPLTIPAFARDGGEEPEIAGIYLIDRQGRPVRIGFALGNEFSDHITERENYLWLAHSKLRQASLGPELRLGELPADVRGRSRIRRGGDIVWEKPFLTGEANMSHSIANLEHHHFKNAQFRRPGDVHVHFFGTSTLSFADGFRTEPGDVIEISADAFSRPLRNPLAAGSDQGPVAVRAL
ncbi:MAG TPA: AraD1 family protein [Magnetospirillaceae bacterium]|nr:AraD1 family protein [Magnetospirillaceae bacterium]